MLSDLARPIALYVHWPYCRSRCPYCDFNAHVPRNRVDGDRWLRAYEAEIRHSRRLSGPGTLVSVFFGGGTPSLMPPEVTHGVLAAASTAWPLAEAAEITLEANPNSVEVGRFEAFRNAGVNRVSIGVQSLDDDALRQLGRGHTAAEARRAVETAGATFPRFSFDLIYGRPGHDASFWRTELGDAIALAGEHLSCYQLTIERGTPFHALAAAGRLRLPEEPVLAELFDITSDTLAAAGLPRYEVSNHARPGAESRHNLTYWRYGDYVGVGPGAHGRVRIGSGVGGHTRIRKPEAWLRAVEACGHGTETTECIPAATAGREMLMMGLRMVEGVSRAAFTERTGLRLDQALRPEALRRARDAGLMHADRDGVRVTPVGIRVLDALIGDVVA
ncbi:MAG: radical SAM family heme chaperone HemW [Rhodospirillales bacterium]|nr:radical SAM family heme chaperone HemW [Rhodospirillales bacterium]